MLDTGIDMPEVVNLVFFKLVRSKTKFWQMLGRGTRLCPDLFGPGKDKEFFYVFDYCQNLEYFSQDIPATEGALGESLGKRLFNARLELIGDAGRKARGDDRAQRVQGAACAAYWRPEDRRRGARASRCAAAARSGGDEPRQLRRAAEAAPRREVRQAGGVDELVTGGALRELSHEVAGLPSELDPEDEEAKRFDLLVLNLQLALLRSEPGFARLRDQVKEIAGLLEEKSAIPMVRDQMALIQDVQTDEWWQDVTVPMLEGMRRRLRDLVKLIEKQKRKPIYTDFEDEMGGETAVELPGFGARHRLREVPRQGAGVPARASGPRRDPQAADEQGR